MRTINALGVNKTLVGCESAWQQRNLAGLTKIGGLNVRNTIPVPTVQGVVRGVPTHVGRMDDLLTRMGPCCIGSTTKDVKMHALQRMTLRDAGQPSQAIRLTFEAVNLPEIIIINKIEYNIRPYMWQTCRDVTSARSLVT